MLKQELTRHCIFHYLMQSNARTFKRITCDPKRINGQPCVRQLRLTVRRVVEAVATYPDRRDLQRELTDCL